MPSVGLRMAAVAAVGLAFAVGLVVGPYLPMTTAVGDDVGRFVVGLVAKVLIYVALVIAIRPGRRWRPPEIGFDPETGRHVVPAHPKAYVALPSIAGFVAGVCAPIQPPISTVLAGLLLTAGLVLALAGRPCLTMDADAMTLRGSVGSRTIRWDQLPPGVRPSWRLFYLYLVLPPGLEIVRIPLWRLRVQPDHLAEFIQRHARRPAPADRPDDGMIPYPRAVGGE